MVVVDGAQHVTAGEGQMPGIEQQGDARSGMAHEGVEFRFGFHHRGHVVVIGKRHALLGAPFPELRDAAPIGLHLIVGEPWLGGERLGAIALDRAAEVAGQDMADPGHVLHDQGLVERHLLTQRRQRARIGFHAQQSDGRIARHLEGGKAPAVKADVATISVGTENKSIEVPTVTTTTKTITVPTVTMNKPAET
eukprot:gene43936-59512_t